MRTMTPRRLTPRILIIDFAGSTICVGVGNGRTTAPYLAERDAAEALAASLGTDVPTVEHPEGAMFPTYRGHAYQAPTASGRRTIGGAGPFSVVMFTESDGSYFYVVYGPGNRVVAPYGYDRDGALAMARELWDGLSDELKRQFTPTQGI